MKKMVSIVVLAVAGCTTTPPPRADAGPVDAPFVWIDTGPPREVWVDCGSPCYAAEDGACRVPGAGLCLACTQTCDAQGTLPEYTGPSAPMRWTCASGAEARCRRRVGG